MSGRSPEYLGSCAERFVEHDKHQTEVRESKHRIYTAASRYNFDLSQSWRPLKYSPAPELFPMIPPMEPVNVPLFDPINQSLEMHPPVQLPPFFKQNSHRLAPDRLFPSLVAPW